MTPKPKLTRQGIRDLNDYRPKSEKTPSGERPVTTEAETSDAAPAVPKKPEPPSAD